MMSAAFEIFRHDHHFQNVDNNIVFTAMYWLVMADFRIHTEEYKCAWAAPGFFEGYENAAEQIMR